MSLKSFFDRFLSRSTKSTASAAAAADWSEKRRSNRVDVFPGDEITLTLLEAGPGEIGKRIAAHVRNVSLRGGRLVFSDSADRVGIELGQSYVAALDVEEFSIPLQVEVIRLIGDREVAVRFKPPFPRELERLEKFLEPRCLGMSVREIDPSRLKGGEEGPFRWFQGINDTQLFCWLNPESREIEKAQLIFLERVVDWSGGEGVLTGRVKDDATEAETRTGWVKSELIERDSENEPRVLAQARTLLEAMNIDGEIRDWFIQKLDKTVT